MISGVAQVIAMKPILRSFFSSGAFSCAIACKEPTGKKPERALIAPPVPTAFKNARRRASCGKSALTRLASMKLALSSSTSALRNWAAWCSDSEACRPQLQRLLNKGRSGSNGLWILIAGSLKSWLLTLMQKTYQPIVLGTARAYWVLALISCACVD